jgi:Phosphotransferase enzyme family
MVFASPEASRPPPDDVTRIERALGWRPTSFRPATAERGTSATAARWIVADRDELGEGRRSAFVKIGATIVTADWFRTEYRNYRSLRGWFLPEVLGFDDDGERPVLALEDLSAADWPPPWTDKRVAAVLDALVAIRDTPPPDHLIRREGDGGADWRVVATEPAPFLGLGLCSPAWLDGALPALVAAASAAPLAGEALVHLDIRSDNLCFRDGRAIVIDWNHAELANPDLDVAFWLPSLHAEGGPPPDTILPDAPALAAWVAGFFCARAGNAPILDAPHVRPLQIRQSRTALPWAARALELPPP